VPDARVAERRDQEATGPFVQGLAELLNRKPLKTRAACRATLWAVNLYNRWWGSERTRRRVIIVYAILGLPPVIVGLLLLVAGDSSHVGEAGLAAGVAVLCIGTLAGASAIQRRASEAAATARQAEVEQPPSPPGRDYRRLHNVWAFSLFGAVSVAAFLVLLVRHHEIATALVLGMAWGAVPQGVAWGAAGVVAPGALIRLRQLLIRGNTGALKDLGDYFSRRMGAEGPTPWENPTARRRVRRQGLIQLAVWGAMVLALLLLTAPLDAVYHAILSQGARHK
jgi:hypothetical protein